MGLFSDILDIFLIVVLGTYYTVSEINFIEKLFHWRTGSPSANEARRLMKTTRCDQSVAVVTGANGGLGLEIARNLAAVGYTVVLACRSKANAEQAIADIRKGQSGESSLSFAS
jgi:NAD(P)H-hydrate repair Nnr-like enzyme with NAD(P)H-hydrate epimerase domain